MEQIQSTGIRCAKLRRYDYVEIASALLNAPPLTEWNYCKKFSMKLAEYHKVKHAILCNSGSSAALVAIFAMKEYYNIPNGSKVIVNALSFPTVVSAIYAAGLIPVFVDVDEYFNPVLEDGINRDDVRGMLLTHILGFPFATMDVLDKAAEGKFLIEDTCDALGAKVHGKMVGTFGDAGILSFFPAHHITTIEGGAVLCNSNRVADIVRSLVNWGRDCWCRPGETNRCGNRFSWSIDNMPYGYDHKYIFTRLGYNLKMNELEAALGYSQLGRFSPKSRLDNYRTLKENLETIVDKDILSTVDTLPGIEPSPFGFPIIVGRHANFTRSEIVKHFESHSIATRPFFAGNITRQPMMSGLTYEIIGDLSYTDYLMENAFWIGCNEAIGDEEIQYILETISDFVRRKE